MDRKRKVYAPFSQTSEAGVAQTPVEGYIGVNQTIYPSVDTGVIDENGIWRGVKSSDNEFFGITKHVAVANGGATLSPDTGDLNFIDMTGFKDIFIAVKPSNSGNYAIAAVMGPDTNRFANLQPINAGENLRGSTTNNPNAISNLFSDSAESMNADMWQIFDIGQQELAGQKNLQFKVTNNSGGESTIEVAFLRRV
tara:strand:- start:242 stop:829 length:588 start_codon:yes stop_codon:yes gene_type:complete